MAEIAIAVPEQQQVLSRDPAEQTDDDDHRDRAPGDRGPAPWSGSPAPSAAATWSARPGQHGGDLTHLGLHAGRGDDHRRRCPGSPRCSGTACSSGRPDPPRWSRAPRRPWGSARSRRSARPPASPAWRTGRIRPSAGHDVTGLDLRSRRRGRCRSAATSGSCAVADDARLRHLQLGQGIDAGPGLELLARDPSTTFSTISRATITPVDTSPIAMLTSVTTTSIRFIGSRSWARATATIDGGFSAAISFRPYFVRRRSTSTWESPCSRSDRSSVDHRLGGGAVGLVHQTPCRTRSRAGRHPDQLLPGVVVVAGVPTPDDGAGSAGRSLSWTSPAAGWRSAPR